MALLCVLPVRWLRSDSDADLRDFLRRFGCGATCCAAHEALVQHVRVVIVQLPASLQKCLGLNTLGCAGLRRQDLGFSYLAFGAQVNGR